jgi:uncharacterized protein (DUF1697 family)
MTTWVAFLRGINIRSNRRVPMAELRELLVRLGHADARTWIVSGNAWFTSNRADGSKLAAEIEAALEARFGFSVAVVVRSVRELETVVEGNPFLEAAADPRRFYAVLLSAQPKPERLAAIDPAEVEPDVFAAGDRVIYAWYRNGLQGSKLAGRLTDRGLGVTATARNWNTVTKMLELAKG